MRGKSTISFLLFDSDFGFYSPELGTSLVLAKNKFGHGRFLGPPEPSGRITQTRTHTPPYLHNYNIHTQRTNLEVIQLLLENFSNHAIFFLLGGAFALATKPSGKEGHSCAHKHARTHTRTRSRTRSSFLKGGLCDDVVVVVEQIFQGTFFHCFSPADVPEPIYATDGGRKLAKRIFQMECGHRQNDTRNTMDQNSARTRKTLAKLLLLQAG